MANLGDKLTVGDREGVVVRAVQTAEGLELTVRVPDEDTARPVSGTVQDTETAPADSGATKAPARPAAKSTPAKGADTK